MRFPASLSYLTFQIEHLHGVEGQPFVIAPYPDEVHRHFDLQQCS